MTTPRFEHKFFKAGAMTSWPELFDQAARFASEKGPAAVRSISHSGSGGTGIVVIWYLDHDEPPPPPRIPLQLEYRFVRGTMIGWNELFTQVIKKADRVHPDQVVSFSHSDSNNDGVTVVWYWNAVTEGDAASPTEAPDEA